MVFPFTHRSEFQVLVSITESWRNRSPTRYPGPFLSVSSSNFSYSGNLQGQIWITPAAPKLAHHKSQVLHPRIRRQVPNHKVRMPSSSINRDRQFSKPQDLGRNNVRKESGEDAFLSLLNSGTRSPRFSLLHRAFPNLRFPQLPQAPLLPTSTPPPHSPLPPDFLLSPIPTTRYPTAATAVRDHLNYNSQTRHCLHPLPLRPSV
jgi:hypothetical protein